MKITETTRLESEYDYTKAEENLELVENSLQRRLDRYKSSGYFNSDEERLEHVLESGVKVTLANRGGLFIEAEMDEALDHRGYKLVTSSELPSHLEIHTMEFDKDGAIKVQLSDKS